MKLTRMSLIFFVSFILVGCGGSTIDYPADGDDEQNDSNQSDGDDFTDGDFSITDGDFHPDGDSPNPDGDSPDESDETDGNENPENDTHPDGDETPDGDSSENDGDAEDIPPYEIVECQTLEPLAEPKTCSVDLSEGSDILFRSTLLTPGFVYVGGEMLVSAQGSILCVGCSCQDQLERATATVVTCPDSVISPGLINTHDHITFIQNSPNPSAWGSERYDHRHDWRKGKRGHTKLTVPGYATREEMAWGELRQVMMGATSVSGSGGTDGFLRNLDKKYTETGWAQPAVHYETFPLGDNDGILLSSGCAYPEIDPISVLQNDCYFPHISEGVDKEARNEFLCLSSSENGGVDLIEPQTTFVHGIGLTAIDGQEVSVNKTSVVWSPRSNICLYGNTAPVTLYHRLGVRLALGTDWTATGSANMVREMRCAFEYSETYLDGFFSSRDIWLMSTVNAAKVMQVDDAVGELKEGLLSDIAIFAGAQPEDYYRTVIYAEPDDVMLVMRGSKVVYGDPEIVNALTSGSSDCETLPGGVCGRDKMACVMQEFGISFSQLTSENTGSYGLFFCGEPTNEPTCQPSRPDEYTGEITPNDWDGDGIPNDEDNCPSVFNPGRPLDDGIQSDYDADGLGDLCDPCPLNAHTADCQSINPDDRDGDHIADSIDNCPTVYNDDQNDSDNDRLGDLCDACPTIPNPGNQACDVTIYAVKLGRILDGQAVSVTGVVTAVASPSFFIQLPERDWEEEFGASYSGIYIYQRSDTSGLTIPVVGQRVKVTGDVATYYGQRQIKEISSIVVLENSAEIPDPVLVSPEVIATGGAKAVEYEGILVRVEGATVTELEPPPGPGDEAPTGEYVLDNTLRVNDYFYKTSPFPTVGDIYNLRGILRLANEHTKLEPRSEQDIQFASNSPIRLISFGPNPVFVDEGSSNVLTVPELRVALNRPSDSEIVIQLESESPSVVSLASTLAIPQGQTSAPVRLNGLNGQNESVTLTARYDGHERTTEVVVVDSARIPKPVSVDPTEATIRLGFEQDFVISLDIPARPGGTVVSIQIVNTAVLSGPASLTIPAGEMLGTARFAALSNGTTSINFSTTAGQISSSVTVSSSAAVGLLLSEVFYNPDGTDDGLEWVEICNKSSNAIDLSGYSLGAGGPNYVTTLLQLTGTILSGSCHVIGGPLSNASNYTPTLSQSINIEPDLQNSGATADGVALFDVPASEATDETVPIDVVIYGSVNENGLMDETGEAGDVDVGNAGSGKSIERTADGWRIQSTPTPNQGAF